MKERIQKFLSRCGIASRRKAEEMILGGMIRVNGKQVKELGVKIDSDVDVIEVSGGKITPPTQFTYYALNKPTGYTSTVKDPKAEKKVTDLVPAKPRVYPVGRLDRNSEGLIILTDDGTLANTLTHPGFSHEKEYRVDIEAPDYMNGEEIRRKVKLFEPGIRLEDGKTRPAEVHIEKIRNREARFRIILKEGKKRQIRRMCDAIGVKVKKLVRIRIGNLRLGNIALGTYKEIKKSDII